nr:CHASE2 domain-containing protein [Leptolyngbya sp. CCY15150]
MLDETPQIVHFSGHGEGEEGLVFEDEVGQVRLVSGEALAKLFSIFANADEFPEPIHCVVLNGCYSQIQAKVIAEYVPYVIGMSRSIGDRAAIEFAVGFYDALGAGRSVEFAFDLGCAAIELAGKSESAIPILLKRSTPFPLSFGTPRKREDTIESRFHSPLPSLSPSPVPQTRTELYQFLLALPTPQFEAVLYALNPPRGNISPASAPQGQRIPELLNWLESPIGPGLESLQKAIEPVLKPSPPLLDIDDPRLKGPARRHLLQWGLKRGAVVAIAVTIARILGGFEFLELKAYDHVLTARMPEPISDRIIVVEVTPEDVETQPPNKPRTLADDVNDEVLINAINQLQEYGAQIIGVDWYLPPDLETWTEPALAAFQSPVNSNLNLDPLTQANPAPPAIIYGLCNQPYYSSTKEWQDSVPPPSAEVIPPELVGFSNFAVDTDRVMRRHLVGNGLPEFEKATSACQAEVAFNALIALHYLNGEPATIEPVIQDDIEAAQTDSQVTRSQPITLTDLPDIFDPTLIERINAYMYGGYSAIDPGAFELMLNYREPAGNNLRAAFTHVSIADLQPDVEQPSTFTEQFEDKIVLIGLTDEDRASDKFLTPYGVTVSGVTLHAHMVDQLISLFLGERRQIWVWPQWGEWLWIAGWAIAGALLGTVGREHPRWLVTSLIGGGLLIYIVCRLTMGLAAGWIPMIPPMVSFILSNGIVVYTDLRLRDPFVEPAKSNRRGTNP